MSDDGESLGKIKVFYTSARLVNLCECHVECQSRYRDRSLCNPETARLGLHHAPYSRTSPLTSAATNPVDQKGYARLA